jgi:hypothetical protein
MTLCRNGVPHSSRVLRERVGILISYPTSPKAGALPITLPHSISPLK